MELDKGKGPGRWGCPCVCVSKDKDKTPGGSGDQIDQGSPSHCWGDGWIWEFTETLECVHMGV